VVDRASQLLGIDCERLEAVMKEKTMKLRGEYITSPQSIEQVDFLQGCGACLRSRAAWIAKFHGRAAKNS